MKNKKLKIVTIGAGSSYTPELCEGIIKRYKEMPITEWVLVDIPEGKKHTEIIFGLVQRMFKKANLDVKVRTSYSLCKADLEGAKFVTTQLRVGMLRARKKDESIPLKNGLLGQETNGLGGQFKAMRTVPVIKSIVEKVKKYANGAWIINFTNPAGMVAEAAHKYFKYKKFIGLCNVPIHTMIGMAEILKTDHKNMTSDAAGLNHMVFFMDFYKNGKKVTKSLIKKTLDPKYNNALTVKNISTLEWNPTFIEGLGVWPCAYHKYYFKRGTMLAKGIKEYKAHGTRAEQVIALEKELFKKYQDPNLNVKPKELAERGGAYYSDVACGVMKAIHADTNEEYIVNVPNQGKVDNLPDDWVIEVSCKINKTGAHKVDRNISLSPKVLPLVITMKNYELMVLKSINKKSLLIGKTAAMINPLSEDDFKTEKAFDQLMKAHAKYIKGYK